MIAVIPTPLVRIMRTVRGIAVLDDQSDTIPSHHFYCPFFSLPRAFETTPDTIPAPLPYVAGRSRLDRTLERPPASCRRARGLPCLGAGQARPNAPGFAILDGRRSMALANLAPLAAVPGVIFVSLQHGKEAAQAGAPPAGMTLFDPMLGVKDFADTAAIVANLDLVISVDTSVVHLAGALGKPVFLLDRYDHCWRWLSGRADSPWYPGMRIFRQRHIGDWDPVPPEATAALADFAAALHRGTARDAVGIDLLEVPETVESNA